MPIPDSWPPHVKQRAEKFLALLKYYRMSRTLSEAAGPFYVRQIEGTLTDPQDILRGSALIAYWFASLHPLCEGWEALKCVDDAVDAQRTPEHLLVLKQYRHTVFHFQHSLTQSRILAFERSHDEIGWAMTLGEAFQHFFDPHLEVIDVERIRSWLFAAEGAG